MTGTTHDDAYLEFLIEVATGYVEARDHLLAPQTWERVINGFPCAGEPLNLWKSPIRTIDFVKYVDSDGALQTWDAAEYQAVLSSRVPCIVPAYGFSWPSARCQAESVVVRFSGGYDDSPAQIPSTIIGAMNLLVGHLYANREAAVVDGSAVEIPLGLERLLDSILGSPRVY